MAIVIHDPSPELIKYLEDTRVEFDMDSFYLLNAKTLISDAIANNEVEDKYADRIFDRLLDLVENDIINDDDFFNQISEEVYPLYQTYKLLDDSNILENLKSLVQDILSGEIKPSIEDINSSRYTGNNLFIDVGWGKVLQVCTDGKYVMPLYLEVITEYVPDIAKIRV